MKRNEFSKRSIYIDEKDFKKEIFLIFEESLLDIIIREDFLESLISAFKRLSE